MSMASDWYPILVSVSMNPRWIWDVPNYSTFHHLHIQQTILSHSGNIRFCSYLYIEITTGAQAIWPIRLKKKGKKRAVLWTRNKWALTEGKWSAPDCRTVRDYHLLLKLQTRKISCRSRFNKGSLFCFRVKSYAKRSQNRRCRMCP